MPDFNALIGEPQVRFGEMIASTPWCLKIVAREGHLLTMNPRGLEMIEADSLESVQGLDLYPLVHPSHRERFRAFNAAICSGESGNLKFDLIGLKGTQRSMETWAAPYLLTTGEYAHIAITNDTTERDSAIETVNQQSHALEVASRLAALGELSAGIAHEINNPLTVIAGHAGLLRYQLESGLRDDGQLLESLTAIEKTVERISSITTALRTISNDTSAETQSAIPIRTLIADTLSLCSEKARVRGIEIAVDLDETLVANVNPVQFSQVLMNLLTNSFHALESSLEKRIGIRGIRDADAIRIEFSDSGPPIDRKIAEQMMTPFFTTKTRGVGTGLGLPISRGIMRTHGGDLRYEPGRATTTFIIEVPVGRSSQ
ncbi:MAG: hypothetical protein K8J08_00135 [Thermoanaerobaculia bacterium]|nr:hypothetical protein [Thermoanaerobaculia bacterium]